MCTAIPAGVLVSQSNQLIQTPQFLFGQTPGTISYAGLAPGLTGLYQFNVIVPAGQTGDAVPLTVSLPGATPPSYSIPLTAEAAMAITDLAGNPNVINTSGLIQPVLAFDGPVEATRWAGVRSSESLRRRARVGASIAGSAHKIAPFLNLLGEQGTARNRHQPSPL
jgi:hypothetical protein